MRPDGQDVLRDLGEPTPPEDKVTHLRATRAVLHAHYAANLDITAAFVEQVVRALVFHGCAPTLLLVLVFLLGVLWAIGGWR